MNRTNGRLSLAITSALVAGLLAIGATPVTPAIPVQASGSGGWSALAGGMSDGGVFQIAPASTGMVYVGGSFSSARSDSVTTVPGTHSIAQWNPTTSAWQAMGGGVDARQNYKNVYAVAHEPTTNRVFVGGSFPGVFFPNGSSLNRENFVIWDVSNSSWSAPTEVVSLRGADANAGVDDIAVVGSGQVYVGGTIQIGGQETATGFFRHTATPPGLADGITTRFEGQFFRQGDVHAMTSDGGNGVIIGGRFDAVSGSAIPANGVARWDGGAWSAFGPPGSGPSDGAVRAVATTSAGLVIGGSFTSVTDSAVVPSTNGLARWNGSSWASIGGLVRSDNNPPVVEELRVIGDYLYVGGRFDLIGGIPARNIARYQLSNGTWGAVTHGCTNGVDGTVRSIVATGRPDGSIYVGGDFQNAGDVAEADRIAVYTPSTLSCDVGGGNVGGGSVGGVSSAPPVPAPTNFRLGGLARERVNGRNGMRVRLVWDAPAGGGANFFVVSAQGMQTDTGFLDRVEHSDLTCATTRSTCSIFFPFTSLVPSMKGRQFHQIIYSMRAYGLFGSSTPVTVGPLVQPGGTTASAPLNVQAQANWRSITVTWDDPADFGGAGFATEYRVQAQPGGNVCTVRVSTFPATADHRRCTFNDLSSRVDYTFTVQALTLNGRGATSVSSNRQSLLDLQVTSASRTRPIFSFPGTTRIRVSGDASGYAPGTPVRTFIEIGNSGWREVRNANVRVDGAGRILFSYTISPFDARRTVGVRFEIDTQGRCGEPYTSAGTCGQSNTVVMGIVR